MAQGKPASLIFIDDLFRYIPALAIFYRIRYGYGYYIERYESIDFFIPDNL